MTRYIEVRPLTVNIGAEIFGVDLSKPLDEEVFKEIRETYLQYQVIFFRDQEMTRDQHLELGRRFGELHVHPSAPSPEGYPEILQIHADENSTDNYEEIKKGKRVVAGHAWHSDVSCDEEPPLGSILYLRTVPETGGDTMFSSMYAAYEGLSDQMQRFLEGLTAVHSGEHVYRGRYAQDKAKDRKEFGYKDGPGFPVNEHPVIRTHPETGKKALYVNSGFTTRIKGLSSPESKALLQMLFEHIQKPEFTCRFRWEPNSIAFWDNRCAQHYAVFDYYPAVRSGERVTIKGSRPFYDPNFEPLMKISKNA